MGTDAPDAISFISLGTYTEGMNVILVQPPFTQLNAPYPAVYYLESFLERRGIRVASCDHSIGLYHTIFSKEGLGILFSQVRNLWQERRKTIDPVSRGQIERYLSYEPLYIEWIDGVVDFLSGKDPAMAHRLASAVEFPRGARTEAFLEERDGRIGTDEARALATRMLDDIGDLISFLLDPAFGTVRYAERIASSRADFNEVCSALDDSWLISKFYEPMLEEFWKARLIECQDMGIDVILITIPFPGCLLGALACARSARRVFSQMGAEGGSTKCKAAAPYIVFGGGYVSTELRGLRDSGIFDFCDYLSFDAGYGSLLSIFDFEKELREKKEPASLGDFDAKRQNWLYRTMLRRNDGKILVAGFPAAELREGSTTKISDTNRVFLECTREAEYRNLEAEAIRSTFPTYRNVDFSSYLRIVDSENPMHRLWSDTPWLKYSLAHGCYWRRCSFCDTELEYVADYSRSDIAALIDALDTASAKTGLYGVHFVDEAMPMAALLDFARANRTRTRMGMRPFSFWGNVRFDSSWTQDRCEFLSSSGLVAVSGGIEIATEKGLEMTDKGFDLAGLVKSLVALKRAGILVHTYLIYGFPDQQVLDIIDSAEFCRQLFNAGLIDSAFWHRFVLTRHSKMYREWKDGKRKALKPLDRSWSFANNDLSFEGEPIFDIFDAPLAASLSAWMDGRDLEKPASNWFGTAVPKASIGKDLAEVLIDSAEITLDGLSRSESTTGRVFWIAGNPLSQRLAKNRTQITWVYRGELFTVETSDAEAAAICNLLLSPRIVEDGLPMAEFTKELPLSSKILDRLYSAGLVVV